MPPQLPSFRDAARHAQKLHEEQERKRQLEQEQADIRRGAAERRARLRHQAEHASRMAEIEADDPEGKVRSILDAPPDIDLSPDLTAGQRPAPPELTDEYFRNREIVDGPVGGPFEEPPGLTDADIIDLRQRAKEREESRKAMGLRSDLLSSTANPDQAAADVDLSEKLGVNRLEVEQDRETARRRATAEKIDEYLTTAPKLRTWLEEPENLAVAHDDTDNLQWWERGLQIAGGGLSSAWAGLGPGAGEVFSGIWQQALEVADEYVRSPMPLAFKESFTAEEMRSIRETGRLPEAPQDKDALLPRMAENASIWRRYFGSEAAKLVPQRGGDIEQGFYSGMRSLGNMLPAIAGAMLTRNPELALAWAEMSANAPAYGEARDKGLPVIASAQHGFLQGQIERYTELIPAVTFFGDSAEPFVKRWMKSFFADTLGEQAATFSQRFEELLALNPGMTVAEAAAQIGDEAGSLAIQTGAATFTMNVAMGAGGKVLDTAAERMEAADQQRRSEQVEKAFAAMAEKAGESKLLKRLPEKFRSFVAAVTKDGPLEQVRIAPEALQDFAQANEISTEALAQAFRIDPADLQAAFASGNDVVIPTANYATAMGTAKKAIGVSGEQVNAALIPHMRFGENDLTPAEREAVRKVVEEEAEARRQATEIETAYADEEDRLRADVLEKIRGLGLYSESTAAANATVRSEIILTWAKRLGISPEQAAKDFAPIVLGGDVAAVDELAQRQAEPIDEETLARAKAALPERDFDIWRRAREGVDNKTLAGEFDKSEGYIRGTLSRARKAGFDVARSQSEHARGDERKQRTYEASQETLHAIDLLARGLTSSQVAREVYPDLDPAIAVRRVYSVNTRYNARIRELAETLAPEVRKSRDSSSLVRSAGLDRMESGYQSRDLVLMFNEGMTDAQIAAELSISTERDVSIKTLQVQMSRARDRLRKVRADEKQFLALADAMYVTPEELAAFIDNAGQRREPSLRAEARRLYRSGVTEHADMVTALRKWADANRSSGEQSSTETLKSIASQIRAEMRTQEADKELAQSDMRGSFSAQTRDGVRRITLFEHAQLDTLLHEGAHEYLDILWRYMQEAEPHPFVKAQWAAVLEWRGLSPNWDNMYDAETGVITHEGRELHEAFAETNSIYWREGKAPTSALRSVMDQIKAWLFSLYKRALGQYTQTVWINGRRVESPALHRANLNPEIAEVFDRMLATDEAINAARSRLDMDAIKFAEEMLKRKVITPAKLEQTKARLQAAMDKAKSDLMARLMEDYQKQRSGQWRDEERQLRREVASEIDERKEQRAYQVFSGKGWKDTLADHADRAEAEAADMLALAQADGYLGSDTGEAREWLVAKAKGLDMSEAGRWARAEELGWTVEAFHETTPESAEQLEDGFDLSKRKAATGDHAMPLGVFTKPTDSSIGIGKTQIPLLLRLGNTRAFKDREDLISHLRNDAQYAALVDDLVALDARYRAETAAAEKAWDAAKRASPEWFRLNDEVLAIIRRWEQDSNRIGEIARVRATEVLRAEGLNSVTILKDVGSFSRVVKTTVVFDPKDIRSVNAAFDPDFSDSPRLLAQRDPLVQFARYMETDVSDASLNALWMRMAQEGHPPVIRLFKLPNGRLIAFDGFTFTHDEARTLMGLGDLRMKHGMFQRGVELRYTNWYDETGSADEIDAAPLAQFAPKSAKTAPLDKLQQAVVMAAQGRDATAIWQATGWGKTLDGEWTYEIKGKPEFRVEPTRATQSGFLEDVIYWPELFDALPALRHVVVRFHIGKYDGATFFSGPIVNINGKPTIVPYIEASGAHSDGQLMRALRHEIQHVIQFQAGWLSTGYNAELIEELRDTPAFKREIALYWKREQEWAEMTGQPIPEAQKTAPPEVEQGIALNLYLRNRGEMQSRDVEHRHHLPQAVLDLVPPYARLVEKEGVSLDATWTSINTLRNDNFTRHDLGVRGGERSGEAEGSGPIHRVFSAGEAGASSVRDRAGDVLGEGGEGGRSRHLFDVGARPADAGELAQSISGAAYYAEPLVLELDARVFGPGRPDDLGFITTAERALENLPKKFAEAKALTADQWRSALRAGGASNEAFTYQIEPALKELARPAAQKIARAEMQEAMARNRVTLRSVEEGKSKEQSPDEWDRAEALVGWIMHKLRWLPDRIEADLTDRLTDYVHRNPDGPRKETDYSEYVAPGKHANYKQELLVLPPTTEAGRDYKSHNWATRGVVGHNRYTDRKTTKGEKVRHVEEMQSDIHQEGARFGRRDETYRSPEQIAKEKQAIEDAHYQNKERYFAWRSAQSVETQNRTPATLGDEEFGFDDPIGRELYRTARASLKRVNELWSDRSRTDNRVPNAPVESWEEPFIRRALLKAAQDGFDLVTFPVGKTLHEAVQGDGTNAFYDERLPIHLARVAKSLGLAVEHVRINFTGEKIAPTEFRIHDRKSGYFEVQAKDRTTSGQDWEVWYTLTTREKAEEAVKELREKNLAKIANRPGVEAVPAIRLNAQAKEILAAGNPLYQRGGASGRGVPPPHIPPMRLDLAAIRDQYGEDALKTLPPEVRAYSAAATDADMFIELARDVRQTLKQKAPKSLAKFLASRRYVGHGNDKIAYQGIRDEGGEIMGMIGSKGAFPGLIADAAKDTRAVRSMSVHDAAVAAWEEGYTPGAEPLDDAAFLDLLERDIRNPSVYRQQDEGLVQQIRDAEQWVGWFDQNQIDIKADAATLRQQIETVLSSQTSSAIGPDEAAERFGFPTGRDLLEGLKQGPRRNEIIRAEVDRRMREQYGDPFRDGTIAREAELYARNEVQQRQLEIELEALARASGQFAAANLAKQEAQAILRTKQVREVLNYEQWLRLEQRWGRKALEAAGKGDDAKAMEYKRFQLINLAMYREARKLAEDIEKTVRELKAYDTKPRMSRLHAAGGEYAAQMSGLLEDILLRPESQRQERQRQNRAVWLQEQMAANDPYAAYKNPSLTDAERATQAAEALARSAMLERLADGVDAKNYKSMTVDELMAVQSEASLIWHLATKKDQLLKGRERRRLTLAAEDIADSVRANQPTPVKPEPRESDLPGQKRKRGVREYLAMHRTLQSLARQMDGGKDGGAVWTHLVRPLNEAFAHLVTLKKQAGKDVEKLFSVYSKVEQARWFKDRIYFKGIGESLTKQGRLAVALNWGNHTNRKRLLDSTGWSEAQVQEILNTLDKRDWDFVQATGDFLDTFFAEANRVHIAVHGAAMEKVEPAPIATRFGVYRGFYFPIRFDATKSSISAQRQLEKDSPGGQGRIGVRTEIGSAKKRVKGKVTLPLRLSVFDVIVGHLEEVTTSIATEEALYDVGRLVKRPEVEDAIVERYGRSIYNEIISVLKSAKFGLEGPKNIFERLVNHLRNGATVFALGWKVSTAALQPLGMTNSIARVGAYWMAQGVARLGSDAVTLQNSIRFVTERSEYMRNRRDSQSAELTAMRKGIKPDVIPGTEFMKQTAFALMVNVQWATVDVPTWYGQFLKSQHAGRSEEDAIAEADQAVIDAQGGGEVHQLAGIQRGGPFTRLFSSFVSYMATTYNLAVGKHKVRRGAVLARAALLSADLVLLAAVPVVGKMVLDALTKGGDDDDDKDLWEKYARQQLAFVIGPFLGINQFGSTLQNSDFGYRSPAGLNFFGEAAKPVGALTDAGFDFVAGREVEITEADLRGLNRAAGIAFHLPTGQIDLTVRGSMAVWRGEVTEPVDIAKALLFGPPPQ